MLTWVSLAYSSNHFWYSGAGKVAPAPVRALDSPSNGPPIETGEPWANAAIGLSVMPSTTRIEARVRIRVAVCMVVSKLLSSIEPHGLLTSQGRLVSTSRRVAVTLRRGG